MVMLVRGTGVIAAAAMLLGILLSGPRADSPLPLIVDRIDCSNSGLVCAHTDAGALRTELYRDGSLLWWVPGVYRDLHVADDGLHLVAGYDGLNLLQPDYGPDTTMLTFWRQGSLLREVPLKELIVDLGSLPATVSHYLWGRVLGIDGQGRLVVQTIEKRWIAFDPATGRASEIWSEAR